MSSRYLVVARRGSMLAGLLVLGLGFCQAEEKLIRLRNEQIPTPDKPAGSSQRTLVPDQPVSGLYLIQFTDRYQAAWGADLKQVGADLISYVPDDAFVAQLDDARVSVLQSKSYVRWIGEYRSEHKIHRDLLATGFAAPDGLLEVKLLLSPKARPAEILGTRRLMQAAGNQSKTRLGTILQARVTPAQLAALAKSSAVLWIERAPKPKLYDEIATKIVAGDDGFAATPALVHQLGFDGSGVTVSVADSGLHNGDAETMHPDLAGRVRDFFHYGDLTDAADEHSHGTHVAGIVAGNGAVGETDESGYLYGLGVAPGASIVAQRIFDGLGGYEPPPTFETLTRDAVGAGAEIGSNSWGDDTQGRYDLSAAEFDALVRDADALRAGDQPYILEFSAGNAGPGRQTIGSPAVAKNVIATGACQNNRGDLFIYEDGMEATADFSSRGPCEDGRIKPDLMAPGTWIASLQSASAGDENAWLPISVNYLYQGGTSQAGPHVSGAAALFVQYYRYLHTNATPSPALVKAALINSTVDMDDTIETEPAPNPDEGWGRLDLTLMIGSDRRFDFTDQSVLLATGELFEKRLVITDADEPLKVTLAYTDVPGLPAAIPALVNDLDLELIAPDGTRYHGNHFENGLSAPNPTGFDGLNNVEGILIAQPALGEYVLHVRARNVAADARSDTPELDQDFALVISGAMPLPGVGSVFMDRRAYTAPVQIKLQVFDQDRNGQPSVDILVRSSVEPGGETVTLTASSNPSLFVGTISTATGPAASDGTLQIAHGGAIEAVYQDHPTGETRMANAAADLVAPVISGLSVTNQFGRMVISWTTDEPANAVVRYSTNASYTLGATNRALTTTHSVGLEDLIPGTTNRYYVVSSDEAGNARTNDNGGAGFTFVAASPATVLLVDCYLPDGETTPIDVSSYTDPLDQIGVSYEVWDVFDLGSPQYQDLRPFQVVIWRVNDSIWMAQDSFSTLSPAQQSALTNYLANGGSFFMGAMEILSRLGDVSFRRDVLQVREFALNPDPFSPCVDCDEDHTVPQATGMANDPISGGMTLDLDYSAYPYIDFFDLGPDFADTFTPSTNAAPIFYETDSQRVCGMRYPRTGLDTPGRVVFLSFPFDAIPETGAAPNTRANLLRNVLGFLAPGLNGLGSVALDRPRYTTPGLVTVEVGDSDLKGAGVAAVQFFSTTETNGVMVDCVETIRRGLFRGRMPLIDATNSPTAGKLRAADGDQIWVEYLDASGNVIVKASAVVDTQPPVITGILGEPDFEDAVITWDTSEPTDALVQFGESPSTLALTRTAYSELMETSHELILTGLLPDKTYYYQVVSRDVAGNATNDNNGGQFYSVRTLKPLSLPYSDNFNAPGTNWTVFDGDETMSSWTLGSPDNGQETAAHSPPNAWGSNLEGRRIDYSDSFLISPAIDLSGGNRATLKFWHSYDFSERTALDLWEIGAVYLFTNRLSDPVLLAEFGDFSFGWEEAEIDLSPHLGRVVYLVMHYQLFSLELAQRPGWLVDDLSLEVSTITPGTVVISNNLAQAGFVLTGPVNRSGTGMLTVISNAPPGDYAIDYAEVPSYVKPAAQNGSLTVGGTLMFPGIYTFPDQNTNGLSDLWEQQYLGGVPANHPAGLDTDGDGMTDGEEFLAGTNPTNAQSRLQFTAPQLGTNGVMDFTWTTTPGREYRLDGSTSLNGWIPLLDWHRATGASLSRQLSPATNGPSLILRLQARP